MTHDTLVLGFVDYAPAAARLAGELDVQLELVDVHYFPDDECRVRLPGAVPDHAVVCRSLDHPNNKLVELMLAASALREHGCKRISLVAPYLCYMRQDTAFQRGEAVSQRIVGEFLAGLFDDVVSVDPHLHRVHTLGEAVPAKRALSVAAGPLMAEFLARQLSAPLLVGPDQESAQWVQSIAAPGGLEHRLAQKQRRGDREVTVSLPAGPYAGREVVLVDDMASTGNTLIAAARALHDAGAVAVHGLVTHALFVEDAVGRLHEAGVGELWSTDSVSHPSNAIHLAPALAQALRSPGA